MASVRSQFQSALINLDTRIQLILIGVIVGTLSGLTAVALTFSLNFFKTRIDPVLSKWALFFFPALGIVVTVIVLKYLIRDFGGHGIPEVIHSVSMRGGLLKFRSSYSKLVGCLITLTCGGSAGPEAPVALSGAAIGSNIATYFKTNEKIRVAVVGAGAAAAIAAIFNAPITGIIFTMEVILGEWTALFLLPVAISSAAGTTISHIFQGNQIPFQHRALQIGIQDILAAAGLAVLTALCAVLMIRALKVTGKFMSRFLKQDLHRALFGGLLLSAFTFFVLEARGEGYEMVRQLIEGEFHRGLWIILLLIFIKIIATSLTIQSGGAGGIFAPSLVLGSLCGLFYFQIVTRIFPDIGFAEAGLFSLVGMAGVLSGTLQAPLTGIFLVFEITRDYSAILPLLIVSFLAATLVRLLEKHSVYHDELVQKGWLRRPRTDIRILSDLRLEELLETNLISVRPEMTLKEVIPSILNSTRDYFPVIVPQTGKFIGLLNLHDIKPYLFTPELTATILVEAVMQSRLTTVSLTDSMDDILKKFDASGTWSLPVLDGDHFLGLVSKATLMDHYRKELIAQTET